MDLHNILGIDFALPSQLCTAMKPARYLVCCFARPKMCVCVNSQYLNSDEFWPSLGRFLADFSRFSRL